MDPKAYRHTQRRLWRWIISSGVVLLLLFGSGYVLTTVRPDLGAQTIELLRAVAGDQAAAWLETTVYQTQDTLARFRYAAGGAAPVAPWEVPTEPAVLPIERTPMAPIGSTNSIPRTTLDMMVRPTLSVPHPTSQPVHVASPQPPTANWPPLPIPLMTTLAGEGQWSAYIHTPAGQVVAYRTFLQPDPQRPDATVAIVAFDTASTRLHFVLGSEEPQSLVHIPRTGMIPVMDRQPGILLAAFNGGFKVRHGHFGTAVDGTVVLPPRTGIGTIALYDSGRLRIGAWGTDITPTEHLHTWRQNGPLVIQHGQLNPHIAENIPQDWGVILNGITAVWRSGLGLSADGRILYYVAGLRLTLPVLGSTLASIGADQAVQLDINTTNVHFDAMEATVAGLRTKPLSVPCRISATIGFWKETPVITSTSRPIPEQHHGAWAARWWMKLGVGLLLVIWPSVVLLAHPYQIASAAPGVQELVRCQEAKGQIMQTTIPSSVYGVATQISVYLPPCYASGTQVFPVIYLLHGANADESQWPDLRVQAAADALIAQGTAPFIVVMPGGAYTPERSYPAFVITDLLPAIAHQFRASTVQSSQAIGGISRGGDYALQIAFAHPNLFAAIGGHSPAVGDLITLAKTAPGIAHVPVFLDVGASDSLQTDTATLAHALYDRGVAVTFRVGLGGHNRAYWRANTADYLRWYTTALAPPAMPVMYPDQRC